MVSDSICSNGGANFAASGFFIRKSGKSVRLVLKKPVSEMNREEALKYYTDCKQEEMFIVKGTKIEVPEHARIFESYTCECCGESTGANWIRIFEGKKLCTDCYKKYDRFNV